ncbi:MAG: ParB N-terminal domain-containing protein [Gammaproteobacteria bacterium]
MKFVRFDEIAIADITVSDRLRQVDADWVEAMAELMGKTGLQAPVQLIQNFPGCPTAYRLNTGAHRLEVAKKLGWTAIHARIVELETDQPEVEARQEEISENVGRRELSALDRAAHLAEWKAIHRQLHPEWQRGGDRKSKEFRDSREDQSEMFSLRSEIAAKTGFSPRTFEAAVRLYEGLSPEAREMIGGTPLAHNQAELVRLSKLSSERQKAILELLLAPDSGTSEPKARKVHDALHVLDDWVDPQTPDQKGYNKLVRAWHLAPRKAQRQFIEYLRAHKQLGRPSDG